MAFELDTLYDGDIVAATGTSAVGFSRGMNLAILVTLGTVTGTTPTLDITVEWSHNGTDFVATDTTPDAMAQLTDSDSDGGATKVFTMKAPYFRASFAVTGTGTPTFPATVSAYTTR